MEFFQTIQKNWQIEDIQQQCRIDNFVDYCKSVNQVLKCENESGEIYCIWGLFQVHRDLIRKGIRISLLNCPNALTFTITREDKTILLHCTINSTDPDPDFIDSINHFMSDLKQGIEDL